VEYDHLIYRANLPYPKNPTAIELPPTNRFYLFHVNFVVPSISLSNLEAYEFLHCKKNPKHPPKIFYHLLTTL
jgi:hypothetical protein